MSGWAISTATTRGKICQFNEIPDICLRSHDKNGLIEEIIPDDDPRPPAKQTRRALTEHTEHSERRPFLKIGSDQADSSKPGGAPVPLSLLRFSVWIVGNFTLLASQFQQNGLFLVSKQTVCMSMFFVDFI